MIAAMAHANTCIGDLIRERRMRAGLSLSELGRRVGASKQRVWNWEQGRTMNDRAMTHRLAEALGLTPEERAEWLAAPSSRPPVVDAAAAPG